MSPVHLWATNGPAALSKSETKDRIFHDRAFLGTLGTSLTSQKSVSGLRLNTQSTWAERCPS
eukprot:scaffold1347_cov350-Pavlova_lutheri.AAC.11